MISDLSPLPGAEAPWGDGSPRGEGWMFGGQPQCWHLPKGAENLSTQNLHVDA